MSNVLVLRDAIVAAFRAETGVGERFNGIKIASHGGEFDTEKEVDRWAANAPAILIAVLKADVENLGGEPHAHCVLGAFCITKDKPAVMRDAGALVLISNVMHYLKQSAAPRWSGVETQGLKNVIARNLYHTKFDEKGLAIWGVFFEQAVKLDAPIVVELPDANLVHVDYDIYPRDNGAPLGEVPDAADDIALNPLVNVDGTTVSIDGQEIVFK